MTNFKFNLKNVATIVACFAVSMMFLGCATEKSEAKKITDFRFTSPAAAGDINEAAKTIVLNVPFGTDVTALTPVIEVSPKATVKPASG